MVTFELCEYFGEVGWLFIYSEHVSTAAVDDAHTSVPELVLVVRFHQKWLQRVADLVA